MLAELDRRKLRDQTDVFVVSDHGFSTIGRYVDVRSDLNQAGFSAQREFSAAPQTGDILINGLGGSIFFYVIGHDEATTRKLVAFLQKQDYTGVIFSRGNWKARLR